MKSIKFSLLIAFIIVGFTINAQKIQQYTPYDELPSVEKVLKPIYNENLPDWAKMLYQYPVNFNEVNKAYLIWEKQELERTGEKKIRNSMIRYYKLWQKHLQPYVTFDGTIQLPEPEKIHQNLMKTQSIAAQKQRQKMRAPKSPNGSNWTFLGPKETFWLNEGGGSAPPACPWQVNIYSFDVCHSNNDVLYCGTETGYVNKTTDKGKTWQLLGQDYVFGGGVTAVAIHPNNENIVYVAAGNAVHKTTDGGITWERSSTRFYPTRLKIDYTNPDVIYASANGMYVSRDAGKTWRRRSGAQCWDVKIKPDDPNVIYGISIDGDNNFMLLESTNAGELYKKIPGFPDNIQQHSGGLLSVTPANPNVLYVVMLSENEGRRPYIYKGIRKAADDWTWTLQHKGSDGGITSSQFTNGQGYFDLVLEASQTNENVLFVGTTTLFKSTNGGKTLHPIGGYHGRYAVHPDIQDIKILPNDEMWVSTDGGMNFSSDQFTYTVNHKAPNYGIVGSDMWGFDQGWNEDIVVGGRYHNGNTAIADFYGDKALRMGGAESPTGWVIQGKSRHVVFDDLGKGWILPKTAEGKPEGRFIFSKHPNMDGYGGNRSNIATHPYYSGTLYVGSDKGIWISKDYGVTFDLLHEFPERVRYLNISTADPNVIYVDVINNGLYKTEDGGETWMKKNSPINWGGSVTFAISPYDANVVYAAHQNGVNWPSVSDVYKTTNGGNTWEKWSNNSYGVKSIVIQPTHDGKDLVYAFVTSNGGNAASVYCRKDGEANWKEFNTNFPSGFRINIALPFYRDSKLRVSGNSGVWESPMAEPDFAPVIVPWAEKKDYSCYGDTVRFDCHSWLNHEGAEWEWSFSPAPNYSKGLNTRTPKVVFKKQGNYDVTLTVTKGGKKYTKTVKNMIVVKCVDLSDCNNPTELPKKMMKLIAVDSYQPGEGGERAFDGDPTTLWHTPWSGTPSTPHFISIDLGDDYKISQMEYLTRSDGDNGNIKEYKLYISDDKTKWGDPVSTGTFKEGNNKVELPFVPGRYAKLVAVNEAKGRAWTSVAELTFTGCKATTGIFNTLQSSEIKAFPIPASNKVTINLPYHDGINKFSYTVYSTTGQQMESGKLSAEATKIELDVTKYPTGYYFVSMQDELGTKYRVKIIKQ